MDSQREYERWRMQALEPAVQEELNRISSSAKEIKQLFCSSLAFGTGGLRGLLGTGTNRMNPYTVGQASQGLSNYLRDHFETPSVCIAYDSRRMSRAFAERAARVFCANGISTRIFDKLHPTPMLSFAVRYLHASAGIVITASHNPKEYNGYKVYGADGVQITDRIAGEISKRIQACDIFRDVKELSLHEAAQQGLLCWIGGEVDKAYYEHVKALVMQRDLIQMYANNLKIVYSPLNGTGNIPVRQVLSDLGFHRIFIVEDQEAPDGDFPTTPRPDPGEPEVFSLAEKLAEQEEADLVIATDPDCDRIGIMARNKTGEYIVLTGNQTGSLLCDYIIRTRKELGTMPPNPAVVKTIVTSDLGQRICEKHGIHMEQTLTGFKYIGELAEQWEKSKQYSFLFGYEESCGCMAGDYVRDKDGVAAAVLIAEMALYYKLRGETLCTALQELYQRYGFYAEKQVSVKLEAGDDSSKIKNGLSYVRSHWTKAFKKTAVYLEDYKNSVRLFADGTREKLELPESSVLNIAFADGSRFVVRPSGTEPKIKLYLFAEGGSEAHAEQLLNELNRKAAVLFQ